MPRPGAFTPSPLLVTILRVLPLLVLLALAIVAMLLGFLLKRPAPKTTRRLVVCVVNVGHGEAAWVRTPGGRIVLIGGGPPGAGKLVNASLRKSDARRIDLLILPYPYAEAIGGLPEVLARFPVTGGAWESGYPPPTPIAPNGMTSAAAGQTEPINEWQEKVWNLLRESDVPIQHVRAGQRFDLGDGVRVEVLAPDAPLVAAYPAAPNNSVVTRITFGETAFLFAGGLERAGETALLARAAAAGGDDESLRAAWLRIARFGSREATSPEFLRRVRPEFAVISVGATNSSGYPHRETLGRLPAAGATVLRIDQARGDLIFESDGARVRKVN